MHLFCLCAQLRYHMLICDDLRLRQPQVFFMSSTDSTSASDALKTFTSLGAYGEKKTKKQEKEKWHSKSILIHIKKAADRQSQKQMNRGPSAQNQVNKIPQTQHFTARCNLQKSSIWVTKSQVYCTKLTLGWEHLTGNLTACPSPTCLPIQLNTSPIRGASPRAHRQSLEIFVSI